MNNSFREYPFPSKRTVVFAKHGVVASSQYLASQAGLDILKQGGNAIDAAIACAACLTVTEPTSNGIGGDAFALIWHNQKLHGLNSSGPAPAALTKEKILSAGHTQIPTHGWMTVTVPGVPAAWQEMAQKFGNLPLVQTLQPAIAYAQHGYPVSPVVSDNWNRYYNHYAQVLREEMYTEWFNTFGIDGRSPQPGEVWRCPEMASTLALIGETSATDFYRGDLAEKMIAFSEQYGGFLTPEDLTSFRPEWVQPLSTDYKGYTIWELPPNGHGLIVLLALNILKNFDLESCSPEHRTHLTIEALKLAFTDGLSYIGDPRFAEISINDLLSEDYAASRSRLITGKAILPQPGPQYDGGTVYLATADEAGNMVSYIQSNYMGFGSGLVVPGTGIALHNRGNCFNLIAGHPNCLAAGKRPYHTIIPGFLTQGSNPIGPFGVMGGMMQPQGQLQVIMNLLHHNLNPKAALDAPRWQWLNEKSLIMEDSFPQTIQNHLRQTGHAVAIDTDTALFGRGQIIWQDPSSKIYFCGTEPRADSLAACW